MSNGNMSSIVCIVCIICSFTSFENLAAPQLDATLTFWAACRL